MNVKNAKQKIQEVCNNTGLSENLLLKILTPFIKRAVAKDPTVKSAMKGAIDAADKFDKAVEKMANNHPTMSPDEVKEFMRNKLMYAMSK
jgi:hypothetical protein